MIQGRFQAGRARANGHAPFRADGDALRHEYLDSGAEVHQAAGIAAAYSRGETGFQAVPDQADTGEDVRLHARLREVIEQVSGEYRAATLHRSESQFPLVAVPGQVHFEPDLRHGTEGNVAAARDSASDRPFIVTIPATADVPVCLGARRKLRGRRNAQAEKKNNFHLFSFQYGRCSRLVYNLPQVLVELLVENYAVVERLRVRFFPGLNVLTGETGSGKSIVVDALGLLFGGRASAEMLRSGAERARVSGIFEVSAGAAAALEAAGIDAEDGELLIEREILQNGKSRAFAANRPVTAALLKELAPHLGDIHGQHDQQELFSASAQLEILDGVAGVASLLEETAAVFREWNECARELETIDRTEQEKLRLLDLWTFQRNEIDAARLKPLEDEALEAERRILQNVAKLSESATAAYEALYDDPQSAYAQLRSAGKRLEDLIRIDPAIAEIAETLAPARIGVEEASARLRDYLGRLEGDPERLEEVETRLAAIAKLKRKYGANIEQVLAFLDTVTQQIHSAENTAERRAAAERRRGELAGKFDQLAARLTAKRQEAARKLERKVETELKSVAMERTVFRVNLKPAGWSAAGADSIEFLVSPNVGEEPRPLDKVASGGELSRIALALKTCATAASGKPAAKPRTLVFDEVDAGIGGVAAEMVGRRLKQLAAFSQVLCVTHLAQIAGFGDHHYAVEKREVKGRTVAEIEKLEGEARTREIGRMLSGQRLTPEALKHAEQLIRTSAKA